MPRPIPTLKWQQYGSLYFHTDELKWPKISLISFAITYHNLLLDHKLHQICFSSFEVTAETSFESERPTMHFHALSMPPKVSPKMIYPKVLKYWDT